MSHVERPAHRNFRDLRVRDVMTRNVISLPIGREIRHAHAEMSLSNVRHILIVSASGETVGLVSERDLYRAQAAGEKPSAPIEKIMTRRLCTVAPDAPIGDAIDLMIERKIGALPVEESENRIAGILTKQDLLILLRAMLAGRTTDAFLTAL